MNNKYLVDGNFVIYPNTKLTGYCYKKLQNKSIDELKQIAIDDKRCLGFSDSGELYFFTPIEELQEANTNQKVYVNKERLDEYLSKEEDKNGNIPKKIHFIWFCEGRTFNIVNYVAIKAALHYNPSYEIYLHCDNEPFQNIYFDDLKDKITINKITKPGYVNNHKIQFFQHMADFVRLNILYEMGGIYLDTDIILLKPLDTFLTKRFVMGYERPGNEEGGHMCNAVIMVEPKNEFIEEWLSIYKSSWGEPYIAWWQGHSVIIPFQLRKKYGYMISIQKNTAFFPFLWDDLSIFYDYDNGKNYEDSYCVHLWDTEASKTNLLPITLDYFKIKNNAFVRLFKHYMDDLLDGDSDFIFYQYLDSPGKDLRSIPRQSIEEMKKMCINDEKCVAFNTLGVCKWDILDRTNFYSLKDLWYCKISDGLFVYRKRLSEKVEESEKGAFDRFLTNEHFYGRAKLGPYVVGKDISDIICINLQNRQEKRKQFADEFSKYPIRFFTAIPHENPRTGCFQSHIECIKFAKKRGYKNVLIFEDDAIIMKNLKNLPPFPEDWNMIYLGGLCIDVKKWGNPQQQYIKGHYYCCHAYLINSNIFDVILELAETWNGAIDSLLVKEVHPKYNAYALLDSYVNQREGWSDIDLKEKWKDYRWPKVGEMCEIP